MTTTLILGSDIDAARSKAREVLADFEEDERAYIWVASLNGMAESAVVDKSGAPDIEDFELHAEAVILGSRVAQQSSWVDAVVAEGLERWAHNLHQRYPGDDNKIESERISLIRCLENGMSDIVIISAPSDALEGPPKDLLDATLQAIRDLADDVIEL